MTRSEAEALAKQYLSTLPTARRMELALLDEHTREEDFGWVFFYNSKKYLETRDRRWALGGNAPVIVDRATGELHVTGTAHPIDHYIAEFRRNRAART